MVDEMKSEAVVLYLRGGKLPFPQEQPELVAARFNSPQDAEEILAYVRALVDENGAFSIDWTKHSLLSGTALYMDDVRKGHPELSEEAVEALGWFFSYSWK